MTDADLATRAPESDMDTNEGPLMTVPLPTDPTPAAPFTPHCTSDRPLPSSAANNPTGDLSPINGISCYISKPKDYPSNPSRLLLLLTPGTGILSTNNQLQADAYASRGYLVVMPDQFNGDPAPNSANTATSSSALQSDFNGAAASDAVTAPPHQGQEQTPPSTSIIEKIKLGMVEASKSFVIDMWLARHTSATVMPRLRKVLEGVREQFADAVANGGGIYGVGYCSGAKYILLLCGEKPYGEKATHKEGEVGKTTQGPELKCGVIAHGTLVTREDLEAVRTPVAMACVRDDPVFPEEVIVAGRASFKKNELTYRIQFYDDVPHGFAVLGDYDDKSIVGKQKEAFEFMCSALEGDDGADS